MKKIIITCLVCVLFIHARAQSDLSFYHLGPITPQSGINNASFFPDAEFYFSLPGISGINVKLNSAISYNQLMRPVEGSDSVKVDLEGALDNLNEGDNLRFSGDVSIFQFGLRSGHRAFTLFANVRYDGGMNYPVNFLNYFVYGNGNFIGQLVDEKRLKGGGIAYHEIGFGYSQDVTVMTDRRLRVGARVKLLHGIAFASVSDNASMTMFTDANSYDIQVQFNDALIRTAGFNELEGDDPSSYIIGFGSNKNTGFAIDLGAQMDINDRFYGSIAINDLGFIDWKQDVENYRLQTSEVTLGGFDDVNDIDLSDALEDSLDVWSEHTTELGSFRTSVGGRALVGGGYHLSENGDINGTIAYGKSAYNVSEFGFGVGYTHRFGRTLVLTGTISKDQHRPVKVGGGFQVRVGSLQLYGVFDDVLNAARKAGDLTGVDARVGLNFVIGRSNTGKKSIQKREKEEISPFPPEYDLDHLLDESDTEGSKL